MDAVEAYGFLVHDRRMEATISFPGRVEPDFWCNQWRNEHGA